jgi:glyoxylase-like metal-dependent hydrolase (beta-lactamase superfamily II)
LKTVFRILAYLLLAVAALTTVVFAAVMLPAHWQIRSVAVDIPSARELDAALDDVGADDFPSDIHFINTAQQSGPFGELGHLGVLIGWADGKSFLIDTGMSASEAIAFGRPFELLGAGPTQTFGAVEKQLASTIDSIRGIGLTHLHSDHTAGITRICAAMESPATIYQSQHQKRLQNLHTQAGQVMVNESSCSKAELGNTTIKPVPGFRGLFAIAAGGHTPGSTVFVTRLAGKTWIFAGDISNAMSDIYNNRGKGFIYSYLLIPEDVEVLRDWRRWLKAQDDRAGVQVLVAHDIDAYRASSLQAWSGSFNGREN